MRDFNCPNCGQRLAFENSLCLGCGSALGFSLDDMALLVIAPPDSNGDSDHAGAVASTDYQLCANLHLAQCNWLVRIEPVRQLCPSCALTRTRPADDDTKAMAAFAVAEQAKRRLIAELSELGLPTEGLSFDLLSSEQHQVFTGHQDGVSWLAHQPHEQEMAHKSVGQQPVVVKKPL